MPLDAQTDLDDDTLLARYVTGDAAAARILTLRLTPRVLAHAMRMLGNRAEAEDVAQDVMLRLWKTAPKWRPGEAKVTTWAYRVTANLCIDRIRKTKGRAVPLEDAPDPVDPTPGAEGKLQTKARNDALQAALLDLPERQRQAVVLRHIEGLGNPEIAEIMDIGARAVESLTARGKRALAQALSARREDLGYGDD